MKMKCLSGNCNHVFSVAFKERFRASRPKCPRCGNGQLEEIQKPKKEEGEEAKAEETQATA